MKAISYENYGSPDVLSLREVSEPSVKSGEVLVRVRAASPNPWDWHYMRGVPYLSRLSGGAGLRKPRHTMLGSDVAGEVAQIGAEVRRFRPGDAIYGFAGWGAFAEFVTVKEGALGPKPANLSFEQAATVPLAATTALHGLRNVGKIKAGQRLLIVGASGGVGTFAVQLARYFGAEVTGVCSARNVELVRSLGADHVIDYTRQNVLTNGQRYDVIFQLAGWTSPLQFRRILNPNGTLLVSSGDSPGRIAGPIGNALKAVLISPFVSQRLRPFLAKPNTEDLQFLADLIEAGRVKPVIDRSYALAESADAIRYLETGRARGKLVIAI